MAYASGKALSRCVPGSGKLTGNVIPDSQGLKLNHSSTFCAATRASKIFYACMNFPD